MDAGAPWTCPACGASNAGYRRRCLDCGDRRAAEVASDDVAAAPAGGDVPLPRLARPVRRPRGRGAVVLGVLVLALAAYGLVSYIRSDRPSAGADRAALEAAAREAFEGAVLVAEGGIPHELLADDRPDCQAVAAELLAFVDRRATAAVHVVGGPSGSVSMHVFRSRADAVTFDDSLREAGEDGCGPPLIGRLYAVDGRARIEVPPEPGAEAYLGTVVDRLQLEG